MEGEISERGGRRENIDGNSRNKGRGSWGKREKWEEKNRERRMRGERVVRDVGEKKEDKGK